MTEAMAFTKRSDGFAPTSRFLAAFAEQFSDGAIYWLTVEPQRSDKTHAHEFAWITEAWKTLPDDISGDYPTAEHLRKRALIQTGWRTTMDYVCASRAEAVRWAENLRRELDPYCVVLVSDSVVRVHRAMSQSRKAMGAVKFQKSKTDILEWISGLLGVEPAALERARAA